MKKAFFVTWVVVAAIAATAMAQDKKLQESDAGRPRREMPAN